MRRVEPRLYSGGFVGPFIVNTAIGAEVLLKIFEVEHLVSSEV